MATNQKQQLFCGLSYAARTQDHCFEIAITHLSDSQLTFFLGNFVNVNSSTAHPLLLTDSKGSTLMCKKYKEFQVGIFWGEGVGWFWGKTRTTVLCGLAPPSIKASITPSHNLNWHSTIPELPITSAANIESDHVFLFFRQQRQRQRWKTKK